METSDYICRSAFIEEKERLYCQNCDRRKNSKGKVVYEIGGVPCRACEIRDVLDDVEAFPDADVRPVVLCRDCVHFTAYSVINEDGTGMCGLCGKRPIGFIVDENDFCSSGERREEGRRGR